MITALRIARRELRGGLSGFGIFLACLALGVAAIAAVGSVRMAIEEGLRREGAVILGGDAAMRMTYRAASEAERAWMEARAETVSEIVDFRSMITVASNAAGTRERALVQVKGIDGAYPIYGQVTLEPAMPLPAALETRDLPGLVAERVLIDRLGLKIGDRVRLGRQDFELRAALTREPDAGTSGFALGPRVIVLHDALKESGLLAPGTLYETDYRLKLPPGTDLAAMRAAMQAAFPDAGIRWRDRRNGAPGIATFVARLGAFLVLVGLASLAVGGVGVSASVRSYLEAKTETIATLKTLGATGSTIFAVYFIQIGVLGLVGIALGLALGTGVPALLGPMLKALLPVPALFDIYRAPMAEAALYGLLIALIFALWPLARAREIRAAALFRDIAGGVRRWPRPVFVALTVLLVAALIGLAAWFAGLWMLALWAAGGVLATLALLTLAARGVGWLARRLARTRLTRGRPALRMALGAVGGPGGETLSVVLSLGLGLTVLAAIGQIDTNMRAVLARELPGRAPAYFVVDIQNDQLEGFRELAESQPGVERVETAPMLRGIITRLNGVPAREAKIDPEAGWVLRGDRGVTYAAAPPGGVQLTEGEWWPKDYSGPPLVSFADEQGRQLGLKLGDTITVNILGREITARVANFRVVNFRDMGINFLMVFDPQVMAGAPHTHLATIYAAPSAEAPLLRALAEAYPNITAVRVRDALDRVTSALSDLATATRWAAGVVLLTGFVVLIGAAAAGERRRVFESAILKTLGATRARILASFALRSALLGAAAGAVAILAGLLAGWAVMVFVMESAFVPEPVSAALIVIGGAVASLLAGLAFALRPLAASPAQVLRARE
ncbi:MAG: FtsX-like permease family protein [Alphaproteobacteria bacterium]|nr:MAG: FtsX-like permease family protein [Alphaproteobacteria bacterium]